VASSGNEGADGRRDQDPGLSDAARARAPTEDFSTSLAELQEAVRTACSRHFEWEAKVVAGIRAVLGFAAAKPAKAHALTIAARRRSTAGGGREHEVIAYFAELLGEGAPARDGDSASPTEEILVEAIATVIRGHLLSERYERLPRLAPDLVYLTLVPYVGIAGARHWAESLAVKLAVRQNTFSQAQKRGDEASSP
jgi:hypothetical protein